MAPFFCFMARVAQLQWERDMLQELSPCEGKHGDLKWGYGKVPMQEYVTAMWNFERPPNSGSNESRRRREDDSRSEPEKEISSNMSSRVTWRSSKAFSPVWAGRV